MSNTVYMIYLIWIISLSFKIKIKIRLLGQFSANKCMLKFNNRSTTIRCGMCLNLIIRSPKRRQLRRAVVFVVFISSGVFIVNFEHISHLFLVFQLLTWNR